MKSDIIYSYFSFLLSDRQTSMTEKKRKLYNAESTVNIKLQGLIETKLSVFALYATSQYR